MLEDIKLADYLVKNGAQKNIQNKKSVINNTIYSTHTFLRRLRPDYLRLFKTRELLVDKGIEGIITYKIPGHPGGKLGP